MAERKPSIYRYGFEELEKCEKFWEFLVEAMQGQPVEQRVHTAGSVEAAWKAPINWYMLSGDAKRDHLERELDNISMDGDEDPKLFFDRAEGKPNVLSTLRTHTSDRDVVRLITVVSPPSLTTWSNGRACFGPASHPRRWKKSCRAPSMLTARPRCWRSESLRRSSRRLRH